jgi:uncharacterized membrane protein
VGEGGEGSIVMPLLSIVAGVVIFMLIDNYRETKKHHPYI